ncbi:MAG: CBS and ACT domain-containing protein [Syntrophobacterales bacterium]|jgi:acetoin utilization protein AcuB
MRVSEIMNKEPITISPETRVGQALKLMQQHQIRHLPVIKDDFMVGWISARTLREVLLASMLEIITVGDVMVEAPISVTPDTSVEEAARLVHEHRIGGMPVLEEEKLVGVITVNDLLSAFIIMLGLLRSSSRLDLLLDTKPETLEKVSRLIKTHGGKIINIALGPTKSGKRFYFFRLEKCDLEPIITALTDQGHQVVDSIA